MALAAECQARKPRESHFGLAQGRRKERTGLDRGQARRHRATEGRLTSAMNEKTMASLDAYHER
ncbi:MAG: hypothetical protein LBK95_17360, partial [Bifidobacteriaceae bacterium]|nr:hypothetical protein [Bifidobacteriaceae bacterium]